MAAIDFPNSPTLNQEFTAGGTIYIWDGSVWKVKSSAQPPSSSIVSYSANAPVNPTTGQVWVESDVDVNAVDTTNFYTKTEVDNALGLKANLASPALSGTPTAPTANAGTNTTQIATTAFVNTAITNLINGAPGALDTLDELAAALGDDANYASTVTNSLALKAPIASPTLTGTPAAPTAAVGTDTTQIATTAFVNAEISNDAIVKSILDAKGDLIVASADNTPAKLTAGSLGQVLVSDPNSNSGLKYISYQTNSNMAINGNFAIWQRGTTSNGNGVLADRWQFTNVNSVSRSTDVPSSDFPFSAEFGLNTVSFPWVGQKIESLDASKLVGKTVTLSFWAKNISGTANLYTEIYYANSVDNFSSITLIASSVVASSTNMSSSWTKYSATFTNLPVQVANGLQFMIIRNNVSAATTRITGIQLEIGEISTPFEFEPYETTLRKCQRYYHRISSSSNNYAFFGSGTCGGGTNFFNALTYLPTTMRIAPNITSSAASNFKISVSYVGEVALTGSVTTGVTNTPNIAAYYWTPASALGSAGQSAFLLANNSTSAWLAFDAEL